MDWMELVAQLPSVNCGAYLSAAYQLPHTHGTVVPMTRACALWQLEPVPHDCMQSITAVMTGDRTSPQRPVAA